MVYLAVEPGLDGEVVVQRELGGNFYGGVSENLRSPIIGASRVELHGSECIGATEFQTTGRTQSCRTLISGNAPVESTRLASLSERSGQSNRLRRAGAGERHTNNDHRSRTVAVR